MSLGFIPETLSLPITSILPSRKLPEGISLSRKYQQIKASMDEIGMIEPLSIAHVDKSPHHYLLLDGHIRLLVLQEAGETEVPCLVATDDEAYTYNGRVNRLSSIQEHVMICRAIERGVSQERLAKALNVEITYIYKRKNLLDGLCPEAIELLKDRRFCSDLSRVIRKMKPARQVECVELMLSANSLTVSYAEALLVATPAEMLVDGKKPRKLTGVSPEQIQRMEWEMANLQGQYKMVEETYGQDVMNLMLARGYLTKLLENSAVAKFLKQRHADMLEQFQTIIAATALDK